MTSTETSTETFTKTYDEYTNRDIRLEHLSSEQWQKGEHDMFEILDNLQQCQPLDDNKYNYNMCVNINRSHLINYINLIYRLKIYELKTLSASTSIHPQLTYYKVLSKLKDGSKIKNNINNKNVNYILITSFLKKN